MLKPFIDEITYVLLSKLISIKVVMAIHGYQFMAQFS